MAETRADLDTNTGTGLAAERGTALDVPRAPERALRGTPPARAAGELASLMRAAGMDESALRATGVWLVSGRRSSAHTQAAYLRDVGWWVWWCTARAAEAAQAPAPMDADLYVADLVASGLARATVNRRVAAVSSWYRYLVREGCVAANPFEGAERPRMDTRHSRTRGLSKQQVTDVLAHAAEHESARTYALLWLMFATAGRIGSLLSARIEDLSEDSGHRVLDVVVKGGQSKRFALPPPAVAALDRYLAERGRPGSGPLFVSRTGRTLVQSYVWKLVNRIAGECGVDFVISPHSFRHSAITIALGEGRPLHVVQDFAGHADPRTTRRYDRDRDALDRSPAYHLAALVAPSTRPTGT
ncbi:tyrosine-type recombinase/integrase [Actinomadura oligospora]|uniref:tyrosine-type recombinase/integrase n=1 Tax=Actinomadura oligospora TaxID=111804 RepID=UPI0004AF4663|nr:tyrosine-type recombinase/integrase [Actinomadura oligospora]